MGKNALFVAQRKNYFQAQTEEVPRILVVLLLVRERQVLVNDYVSMEKN